MRYRILFGLTTLLALLKLGGAVLAKPSIPAELKDRSFLIQELSAKEKKILKQLEELSRKIDEKRQEIENISEEIARKELVLRQLKIKLKEKEKAIQKCDQIFRERLKRLATTGKLGWLNLILAPKEISSFFRRQEYVYLILYHDQELAQNLKLQREEFARQKALINREKRKLEELRKRYERELVVLKKLKREKESLLEEVRRSKRLYMETMRLLENAYAAISQMAEELKKTRAELEATREEIKKQQEERLKRRPLLEVKGLIPPPFEGEVIHFFGLNEDPLTGKKFYRSGITIAAPPGSPVKAPYAGKIVKISYLRQKGVLVFIDHGYHFLSVIGGLGKVTKGLGEEVSTGEVIGEVGESPYEEPGVYYELRYRGKPQDPLEWLDTSKLKILR